MPFALSAIMWYWLRQFEGMLLYLPFLAYALSHHIPYYTRCSNCGKRLFTYWRSMEGLCERCAREKLAFNAPGYYGLCAKIAPQRRPVGAGLQHCYRRVAKGVGHGMILDVGCGGGILLSMLEWPNRELHGIDLSPEITDRAKMYTYSVNLCVGDSRRMPFKSDAFDYLTCTELLEHIEGDNAIRECYRVLKPNGTALFVVPNGKGVLGKATTHVRFFSFKSFIAFLQEAGFEVVSSSKFGLYIPFITHSLEAISMAAGKALPLSSPLNISVPESLAASFFVECSKPSI